MFCEPVNRLMVNRLVVGQFGGVRSIFGGRSIAWWSLNWLVVGQLIGGSSIDWW
jgi:hypothetical protein